MTHTPHGQTSRLNPAHLFAEPLAMSAEHAMAQMTYALAAMNGQPIKPEPRVLNLPAAVMDQYSPFGHESKPYHRLGPLAIVQIEGPMWYSASVWSAYCEGGSVSNLLHALEAAGADTEVKAVALAINSPGGEHHPLSEIADAMRRLKAIKPIHALVNNIAYSQGFMAASLATEISAVHSGACGSIGSIAYLLDSSKNDEADGFKMHAVTSASLKAAGGPGQSVSDEQLAAMQNFVDQCGADFAAVVVEGRAGSKTPVTAKMIDDWDGRVFYGQEMVDNGLVDRLESEHAFYGRLMDQYGKSAKQQSSKAANRTENTHTKNSPHNGRGDTTMATMNESNAELIKKLEDEEGVDNKDFIEKIKSMSDDEETKNESDTKEKDEETKNESDTDGDQKKEGDDSKTKNQVPKNTGGTPATFNELSELVPQNLDNRKSVIVDMLTAGTTVAGAGAFVQNQLVTQINTLNKQRETDAKIAKETSGVSNGRAPIRGGRGGGGGGGGTGGGGANNATLVYENARDTLAKKHGIPKNEAVQRLRKEQPEIVDAWVSEVNNRG